MKYGIGFKSTKAAALFSLLLPGGGYFYTGHPILGLVIAMAEIIPLVLFVLSLAGLVFETVDPARRLMIPIAFGVSFLVVKIITVYQVKHFVKEYPPLDRSVQSMADNWGAN